MLNFLENSHYQIVKKATQLFSEIQKYFILSDFTFTVHLQVKIALLTLAHIY